MILLSGPDVVLPDRITSPATIVIDGERIVDVLPGSRPASPGDRHVDLHDHVVVPGFIDVHVHGVEGCDTLDGADAVRRIARRLPRYGVTAFCPTTVACTPAALREFLADVRVARTTPTPGAARVLPAHLESNFISVEFRGAQPLSCLRRLPGIAEGSFSGTDVLAEIEAARPDVGIVTVAPEVEGVLDLIRDLVAHGHHVSLGHSGASYEEALEAIRAGARHVTHLFNRMLPLGHREPGLAGAALEHKDVTAELVCDGLHVHPAVVGLAIAAKSPDGIMAITDGTAGSGLPRGSEASLGGRRISVGDVARLEDGTIAGSVLTMDRAFALLVSSVGLGLARAATVCATTPARALGLHGFGVIVAGSIADLVVLDRNLNVRQTFIAGRPAL